MPVLYFVQAVKLLKPQGRLVYSTCTITLAENEGLIAWALKKFPCLELEECKPSLGGPGFSVPGLAEDQACLVQRFGPDGPIDSDGFFIASFRKHKSCLDQ